jgi:hypothetical protein
MPCDIVKDNAVLFFAYTVTVPPLAAAAGITARALLETDIGAALGAKAVCPVDEQLAIPSAIAGVRQRRKSLAVTLPGAPQLT